MTVGSWLAQTSQVEEVLTWTRMPPAWVVVLIILPLVIAFAGAVYWRERLSERGGLRWVLAGLRALVLLLVLAMLAGPVIRRTTYETRDSTLLVLVDDSLSMDVVDRYSQREIPEALAERLGTSTDTVESTTRYDLVRRLFADGDLDLIARLRKKGKVAIRTFARGLRGVADLPKEDSGGTDRGGAEAAAGSGSGLLPPYESVRNDARVQETRIADALRDAMTDLVGSGFGVGRESVSGVILISDGQENAGTASAMDVGRRFGERGVPIHTVGVGNPDDPRDVRLTNVDVDPVVLVDDRVPLDVTLIADGFEGENVGLELEVDSVTVQTRYISLRGGGEKQVERLEFRPREPGEFTVVVKVEKLGGEVFYDNNSLSRTVRVLDEKIRVLYLEDLPRWEYRYLKNALVRDETMETRVWLLSADPEFIQESSPGVSPLRALPSSREELLRYHVVILGDVDPDDLGPELTGWLKEFVQEGGGIVFIAGQHANPSQYVHTDLYPLLPVEVRDEERFPGGEGRLFSESFKVRLTPAGKEHPVLRLDADRQTNLDLWEDDEGPFYETLPGFYRYVRVEGAKAGTLVLARHPTDIHPLSQKGRVIFATMTYGKGRAFFSAVDDTWRWRAGVENLYYSRFWGQVIRFVASGRLLGKTPRFEVTSDKVVYDIGESVKVEARVLDADMKPSREPTVTLYHQAQGREGEPAERIELSLDENRGEGVYEGDLVARERGGHELWLGTAEERLAFRSFRVEIPALESRDPKLDREFLKQLAERSGGRYHDLADIADATGDVHGVSRSQEGSIENDELWDEGWVLVLFTLLIGLEWVLRKWVRLP